MFEGQQREYVAPDVGCATGVAAGTGFGGQVCTTNCTPVGGFATGGYATGGYATGGGFATGGLATGGIPTGAGLAPGATGLGGGPIVHNRKLPLRERALAKVTGRPVVTNYR